MHHIGAIGGFAQCFYVSQVNIRHLIGLCAKSLAILGHLWAF